MDKSRVYNSWPIALEGLPFVLISLSMTLLFFFLHLSLLSLLFFLVSLFVIFFFRDPERTPPDKPGAVLSPADGTVIDIREVGPETNPLGRSAIKISIFMSLFNVHVNRIPVSGTVKKIAYHPGKFFSANLDKASEQNEKKLILLDTEGGERLAVVQIAGLIARRIVCWVSENDRVLKGQRFGLIRFGSRLEVYFYDTGTVTARKGQKVRAGETILGYLS